MTLIVATQHWKGICISSDTRATRQTPTGDFTYEDNALKVAIIKGGLGMGAAGNKAANVIFKALLNKVFNEQMSNPTEKIKSEIFTNPVGLVEDAIETALLAVKDHPDSQKIPRGDESITIKGVLGGYIPGDPLILNKAEVESLFEIIINSPSLNSIYSDYLESISACLNGARSFVQFDRFNQTFLFTYSLTFNKDGIIEKEITRVPFGKIVAFGSGSHFAYETFSPRILGWVLFAGGSEDIQNSAIHLTQVHSYADNEVEEDNSFNFRTFGGGIVPVAIMERDNGTTDAKVVLVELLSKPDRKLISETLEKDGTLWIKTEKGIEKLVSFPDIQVPEGVLTL